MQQTNKILIALQFWEGDKPQAMQLARFLADIQPVKCPLADFLFISRFDCEQDMPTIKYVSSKFDTHFYRSRRRGKGWPHGCNELWFETMAWFYHKSMSRQIPIYKAIFTCESDSSPMASNWIAHFSTKWDELNEKKKIYVAGALVPSPALHCNGNMLVARDPEFLNWLITKIGGAPADQGWDYWLRGDFERWGWAQLPGFKSYWGKKTMTNEEIAAESGTVWVHGVKDNSLHMAMRNRLLGVDANPKKLDCFYDI